jgi:HEAT repeat protein
LPLRKSLSLGRPARSQEIALTDKSGLVAQIAGASIAFPARGVKTATVESVAVASDAAVAIVRASADNGEWVALLGGKTGHELLLAERTDLVGDPGERRAAVVEVRPGADNTVSTVTAAVRYEGLNLCGTQQPLLASRRTLDPKTLKLSAQRGALDLPTGAVTLTAKPTPAGAGAPLLRALSAQGSSQIEESTHTSHVPRSLLDERPETGWSAHAGDAALLRWSATGVAIERLEIRLGRRAPSDPATQLSVFTDRAAFRCELPNAPAPDDTWTITLPPKTLTSCLAIGVGEVPGTLAIAELRAFSEFDREHGGMDKLLSSLVQDGESAARAADLLAGLGEPAARLVASRFGELSTRGQRRALKILANALGLPDVRARVVEAARNREDEHLSAMALTTLSRGKTSGAIGLRELAQLNEPAGDAAARVLVLSSPSEAPALLQALGTPDGADRPSLRRALVSVAQRDPAAFRSALDAWLASSPTVTARIGLALVTAGAGMQELATSLVQAALEEVQTFADRFRLAQLAGELGASEPTDAWLSQQSMSSEEWMIRRAAYVALAKRNPEAAQSLTLYLANDEYPRVRAAAVPYLAQSGNGERLALLAGKDPWPLVRSAAAASLAGVPGSRPILEKLLDDTSRRVRTAAIDALTAQQARDSWPLVEQRLSATAEWPEVQAAAVRFASTLCVGAARPHLTHLARRALRPDASDDDRRLGQEAVRALHDLGGEAAEDAKLLASRELASPELQQAIAQPGPARCGAKASSH